MSDYEPTKEPSPTEQLVALVADMRRAQKAWYMYRQQKDLIASKRLEHKVDRLLSDLSGDQKQLF